MGEESFALTGPRSSTGSPITLMMRPRVSGPTGTAIGAPVSSTSAPRTRPSVVSIAIVRTVFSPRCCATSSTRVLPWFCVCSALRIDGSSPSNFTSTTAPMTWLMVPVLFFAMISLVRSERLGARDDLDEFFCDDRLTGAVVGDRQTVDHLARVPGRAVHRRHARPLLRRGALQERGIDLDREVGRQQLAEDLVLLRLELVDAA